MTSSLQDNNPDVTPCSRGLMRRARLILVALLCSLGYLLALSPAAWAAATTSGDAQAVVTAWVKKNNLPLGTALGAQVRRVEIFKDDVSDPLYYVVYLNPRGYVIVPADDCVEPILAFAPSGKYDPADTNPLGALVSRDIKRRMKYARSKVVEARQQGREFAAAGSLAVAQRKWTSFRNMAQGREAGVASVSDVRVGPLVASSWDQMDVGGTPCYNFYTPGPNYPTGCIAAAMGQLMRYYQYPTTGVGTTTFAITVDFTPTTASLRGGNGSGGPYDWSDMVLVPTASITASQRQAIGALLYDAGVSVNMDYEDLAFGGSSANTLDAANSLVNTFSYGNAIRGFNANADIGAPLITMLNPNLDADRPALIGIHDSVSGSGHAVVCDGYGYDTGTLYHHLNMGWSGTDNAWYNLPTIDAPSMGFDVVTKCVYNVFETGTGEIISGRATCGTSPVSGVHISAVAGVTTYTTTTNSKGIYALTVPSATAYTVTASKAGYVCTAVLAMPVSTGTSTDDTTTCGNFWGCDFTLSQLPMADSQTVYTRKNKSIAITVKASGNPFAYNLVAGPSHGSLTGALPNVTYTPTRGYVGGDLFTFTATNASGTSGIGTVNIRVRSSHSKGGGGGCALSGTPASSGGSLGWMLPYMMLSAAYLWARVRSRRRSG
jgi:hypothetical protein